MDEHGEQDALAHGKTLQWIRLEDLKPDPDQPRQNIIEDEELRQLAQSLKDHGQQQALDVWHDISDGKFPIVDGERRLRAAKLGSIPMLLCCVGPRPRDEKERRTRQLVPNIHRKNLDPLDLARMYRELANSNSWDQGQVAEYLHLSESHVSRMLKLLKLPPQVQKEVSTGQKSATKATRRPGPAFRERFSLASGLTVKVEGPRKRVDLKDIIAACGDVIEECRRRQKRRPAA
jgi:ParB family chromosome partitioning protein